MLYIFTIGEGTSHKSLVYLRGIYYGFDMDKFLQEVHDETHKDQMEQSHIYAPYDPNNTNFTILKKNLICIGDLKYGLIEQWSQQVHLGSKNQWEPFVNTPIGPGKAGKPLGIIHIIEHIPKLEGHYTIIFVGGPRDKEAKRFRKKSSILRKQPGSLTYSTTGFYYLRFMGGMPIYLWTQPIARHRKRRYPSRGDTITSLKGNNPDG